MFLTLFNVAPAAATEVVCVQFLVEHCVYGPDAYIDVRTNVATSIEVTVDPLDEDNVISVMGPANEKATAVSHTGETLAVSTTATADATLNTSMSRGTSPSGFACVKNGSGGDRMWVWTLAGSSEGSNFKFRIFGYHYPRADRTWDLGVVRQFELCSVHAYDADGGFRQLSSGTGFAINSKNPRYGIGAKIATGKDVNPVSATLGFSLGGGLSPVTISGEATHDGTTGEQDGKQGARDDHGNPLYGDVWAENQVVGWWKSLSQSWRWSGSTKSQSQVHHGLYEVPMSARNIWFYVDAYAYRRCSNWSCPD